MAKARARRRSKAQLQIPVAVIAGMLPLIEGCIQGYRVGGINGFVERFSASMTGWMPNEKKFEPKQMMSGAVPMIAGVLAHKFIGQKLGVNRALSQAGVPFIRI